KQAGKQKPKKLAEFTLDIVKATNPAPGDPPGTLKLKKKPSQKLGADTVRFNLLFAGETFVVGLPDLRDEAGRRFEIQLVATAGKGVKFESKALLFARFGHFKNDVPAPVIAFITGAESGAFFKFAANFWRQHADVVIERDGMSLQEIVQFLGSQSARINQETGNKGWGEVNIVCHGNKVNAFIALLKGATERDLRITTLDNALKKSPSAFNVTSLGLTQSSRVVFRACNIGNRPDLLARVKMDVFGGACSVKAPKFLQKYSGLVSGPSTGPASEGFVEDITVHFPQADRPSDAVIDPALRAKFAKEQAKRKGPPQKFDDERDTFPVADRKFEPEKGSSFSFGAVSQTELLLTLQPDRRTVLTLEQVCGQEIDKRKTTDAMNFCGKERFEIEAYTGKRSVNSGLEMEASSSDSTGKFAFCGPGGSMQVGSDDAVKQFVLNATDSNGKPALVVNAIHSPAAGLTGRVAIANGATVTIKDEQGKVAAQNKLAGEASFTHSVGGETLTFRRSHSVTAGQFPLKRFTVSFRRDLRESKNPKDTFAKRLLVVPNIDDKSHYGSSEDPAPTQAELEELSE
ncbi:MAG TPA: hypothetical protein VG963_20930, partial [Polyangiaceae bacterium]|nr:hypothetical protein [Polyangiaceae bacterium]